ncbi:MAG: divalent-cation tolerance protein CutA [Candidatus Odinarchaeia archaeon]
MYIIVFVTTGSFQEAEKIANIVVSGKIAACVNIIPKITSIYWWKGKIEKDEECLLVIKTLEEKYSELEKIIFKSHSYENPEIICIPITKGSKKYFKWIEDSLKKVK